MEKIAAELNVPLRVHYYYYYYYYFLLFFLPSTNISLLLHHFQVFVSTGKGFYRKPSVGMWESLCKVRNNNNNNVNTNSNNNDNSNINNDNNKFLCKKFTYSLK